MVRTTPPDRVTRLLEVAAATFIEHGFQRTQMDDIADRLGVSKGTVYRAVESKEALFAAVVTWADSPELLPTERPLRPDDLSGLSITVAQQLSEAIGALELARVTHAPSPPRSATRFDNEIQHVTRDLYRTLATHRTTIMVLDRCAAEVPELTGDWYEAGRYALVDLWHTYLASRSRFIESDVDRAVLARTIVEIITVWAVKMHWDPAPRPYPTDMADACASMIENLVRGATR